MKKSICLVCLFLLFCLLFTGCDPGSYFIHRDTLDRVVSIELIQYENSDQKHFNTWVIDRFDKLLPFELSKVTILQTLPQEDIPELLDAFSYADILHTYYAYNSPKDICLRFNYDNGDFLIVWANYAMDTHAGYIGEYSSTGSVISFWGCFSALSYYEDLVNQYFNLELP